MFRHGKSLLLEGGKLFLSYFIQKPQQKYAALKSTRTHHMHQFQSRIRYCSSIIAVFSLSFLLQILVVATMLSFSTFLLADPVFLNRFKNILPGKGAAAAVAAAAVDMCTCACRYTKVKPFGLSRVYFLVKYVFMYVHYASNIFLFRFKSVRKKLRSIARRYTRQSAKYTTEKKRKQRS